MHSPGALKFRALLETANILYCLEIWGKEEPAEKERSPEQEYAMLKKEHPRLKLGFLQQEHGDELFYFQSAPKSMYLAKADAIYTDKENFACTVRSADCVPILGYSSQEALCFAIHAGWRGLYLHIIEKTLTYLREYGGVKINNLRFFIGPHIQKIHYEVGEDVYSLFRKGFYEKKGDKAYLDLGLLAKKALTKEGVKPSQISYLNLNTYRSDFFFSHRAHERGRNLSLIYFILKS